MKLIKQDIKRKPIYTAYLIKCSNSVLNCPIAMCRWYAHLLMVVVLLSKFHWNLLSSIHKMTRKRKRDGRKDDAKTISPFPILSNWRGIKKINQREIIHKQNKVESQFFCTALQMIVKSKQTKFGVSCNYGDKVTLRTRNVPYKSIKGK